MRATRPVYAATVLDLCARLVGISLCVGLLLPGPSANAQLTVTEVCTSDAQPTPSGQDQVTFVKTIGGPEPDWGSSLVQTRDEHYVVAGWSNNFIARNSEFLLFKTDRLGELKWAYRYSGFKGKILFDVSETTDRGYALIGRRIPNALLIKTDANGKTEWARKLKTRSPKEEWGPSVVQTSDGGYAIVATGAGFLGLGENENILLLKTDQEGQLLWGKSYGGKGRDRGSVVLETRDRGYLIGGITDSFNSGQPSFLLMQVDPQGEVRWARTLGGASADLLEALVPTPEGGYVVVGETMSYGAGDIDILLAKIDSSGSLTWARVFGTSARENGVTLVATSDGGFVIGGYTTTRFLDGLIIKTDSKGQMEWARRIDRPGYSRILSLVQTTDGGYAATGVAGRRNLNILFARLSGQGKVHGCTSHMAISDSSVELVSTAPEVHTESVNPSVKSTKKLREISVAVQ